MPIVPKRSSAGGGSLDVKHDILDHQPEKDHIATGCALVAKEDEGLEIQKEHFSPKIKDVYGYLFKLCVSMSIFPTFSIFCFTFEHRELQVRSAGTDTLLGTTIALSQRHRMWKLK